MLVALILVGCLLVVLCAAELYARFVLGLGDPPLWLADPEIEYLPRPSQRCVRFGNRICYNAHSMRSRELASTRDPDERRVLVVGDSIVNGGAETDQDELATTILENRLADRLGRPVFFGNIAAGSWGPPNCLAYLKRYGFFEADLVVVVINSSDYNDAPTFAPLRKSRPQKKPRLALQEISDKYLPRLVRSKVRQVTGKRPVDPADVEHCLGALEEIIDLAREAGADVLVAQHLKRSELRGEREVGYHEIARVVRSKEIEPIDLGPAFARALEDGPDPYTGDIHPTARGQRIIADELYEPIRAIIEGKDS